MPSWMTTPSPTATRIADAPHALPRANMSMPWSSVQLPDDSTWRGLANGNTNPLALAVAALTVTVVIASGDGASPLAPGNRMPTCVVRVKRFASAATPYRLVRSDSGELHADVGEARSQTLTGCEAMPRVPSLSRCPAIVTWVLTGTAAGALGAMSMVCTTVVAVSERTTPVASE